MNREMGRDFARRRVTIIGLGREGVSLARFLARQGAEVTVSDQRTEDQLGENLAQVAGLPLRLSLGANRVEDVVGADIVFISPGVPGDLPAVRAAEELGIPISAETQLFFQLCPAPILGVTGSSGKTTTTSLLGEVFRRAGRRVFVGGNIGVPLLDRLDEITADSWVIMELSSFQLERLTRSPHIGVITNITPNHLDRHPTMEHYIEAKKNILRYQGPDDYAVLNADNACTSSMAAESRASVLLFSRLREVDSGAWLEDTKLMARWQGRYEEVCDREDILLRGEHNIENVLAVAAATIAAGLPLSAVRDAVRNFPGVEHRLEFVMEINGVQYYNDSIATSPERSLAAMRSFTEPIVLLAGGREKHLPLEEWARTAIRRCRAVVLFGEAAPLLEKALDKARQELPDNACSVVVAASLEAAVKEAAQLACPGDVVLLSPACTSFDAFRDFEERGHAFKKLVGDLGSCRSFWVG